MQQQFVGLTMPVFIAFGWAEEEQAMKFAISQLSQFIGALHASLPRRAQNLLPSFGMNEEDGVVYLAADSVPEEDVYIAFITRPMSLEVQLAISDEAALGRAWKAIAASPDIWLSLMQELEGSWSLHIKQMEVDEESGERSSYQEIYRDEIENLDAEQATEIAERASYLNSEARWAVPIYVSRRFPAEPVATMNTDVVPFMVTVVRMLVPLLEFVTGRGKSAPPKKVKKVRPRAKPTEIESEDPDRQFVYVTTMKPLHIRRGFINLTADHWDFFAESARATTRDVIVKYEDKVGESSVWRLRANDMARVVLSDAVRDWVQEVFEADDKIQVTATQLDDDQVEVVLEPVD